MSTCNFLTAALEYIRQGLPVFPCHSPDPTAPTGVDEEGKPTGGCSCQDPGCRHPGKHPRLRNGFHGASVEEQVIRRWAEWWPNANVAVPTGAASGADVVDVDGPEGKANLQALGGLPATPVSATGRGWQLWFRHVEGVRNHTGILPSVDVRGEGGYVVAPPSQHYSGRPYTWQVPLSAAELVEPPEWLLRLMLGGKPRERTAPTEGTGDWVTAALSGVEAGARNDTAARLAGRYLGKGLPEGEVLVLLTRWNRDNEPPLPEDEIRRTVASIARADSRDGSPGIPQVQAVPITLQRYAYHEFLTHPFPQPEPVIGGMARLGEVIGWHGAPGTGKSAAATDACRSVSSGRRLFGVLDCRHGAAVYIEQESAPNLLQGRLREFEVGEPLAEDAESLVILPFQGLRFDEESHRAALRQVVEEVRPVLLVVDTISATAGKVDLLRPEEVGPWIAYFRGLATDFALAVVLIGHEPKWAAKEPSLKSFFGSVDWGAKVDGAFAFSRVDGQADTFRVAATKSRWTAEAEGLDLTFTIGAGPNGGLVLTSSTAKEAVEKIILRALDSGDWVPTAAVTRAVQKAGYTDRTARTGIAALLGRQIEERGEKRSRQLRLLPEGGTS